ncbi:MAG TPA: hypothetical protein VKA15_24730 [Isosphaeraceae bacterium]|nr:hypothetical protein [Isosphaeraceae bacterium]
MRYFLTVAVSKYQDSALDLDEVRTDSQRLRATISEHTELIGGLALPPSDVTSDMIPGIQSP